MNINNSDNINNNNNNRNSLNNSVNNNSNDSINNNSNRNSLRNSLNNSINGNGLLQNTPTANSINSSGNFSPKEFVSNLDSEDILYENKNVEYKSKSCTIQIKQSTMIIKFNEKNGFTKYLVSDTIVGSTLDKTRRRKQFILNFKSGNEASEFNNQFTESFLDTLPKGNPKERRVKVILNPKSGKKMSESIFNDINQLFKDANINVKKTVTKGPDHAKQIGYKFKTKKYDTIVFISGDGLFHEFVNGLLSRPDYEEAKKIPLALIPGGTGNGIACSIGLQDPMSCALAIIRGYTKPLDVSVIQQGETKWCSILSVSWNLLV